MSYGLMACATIIMLVLILSGLPVWIFFVLPAVFFGAYDVVYRRGREQTSRRREGDV